MIFNKDAPEVRLGIDVEGRSVEVKNKVIEFAKSRGYTSKLFINEIEMANSLFFGGAYGDDISFSDSTVYEFNASNYKIVKAEDLLNIPDDIGINEGLRLVDFKSISL